MKYGILFLILGGFLILQAGVIGGVSWILVWPGLSFVVVAAAYLGLGPGVFGKRPDGTMAWYAVALLLPYLLQRLAADYNVLEGGLLPFGMIVLLFAPLLAGKLRHTVPTR